MKTKIKYIIKCTISNKSEMKNEIKEQFDIILKSDEHDTIYENNKVYLQNKGFRPYRIHYENAKYGF